MEVKYSPEMLIPTYRLRLVVTMTKTIYSFFFIISY